MTSKGFDKKKKLEKQFDKIKKLKKNLEDAEALKSKGVSFGNEICSMWTKQAQDLKSESEKAYGRLLIEARLIMVTALADLQSFRAGIPGKTNEKLGEILRLTAIFWQGSFSTERLISEGQYIQAAAAIKQEIEILTRISEIKKGTEKNGKTPNVKNAPLGFKEHYGDMNDLAHISQPHMLDTLTTIDMGSFRGVAIQPVFHEGIAKNLYEIHLNIFYNLTLEEIELCQQLYPDDIEFILPACRLLEIAKKNLAESGFVFVCVDPK